MVGEGVGRRRTLEHESRERTRKARKGPRQTSEVSQTSEVWRRGGLEHERHWNTKAAKGRERREAATQTSEFCENSEV